MFLRVVLIVVVVVVLQVAEVVVSLGGSMATELDRLCKSDGVPALKCCR